MGVNTVGLWRSNVNVFFNQILFLGCLCAFILMGEPLTGIEIAGCWRLYFHVFCPIGLLFRWVVAIRQEQPDFVIPCVFQSLTRGRDFSWLVSSFLLNSIFLTSFETKHLMSDDKFPIPHLLPVIAFTSQQFHYQLFK